MTEFNDNHTKANVPQRTIAVEGSEDNWVKVSEKGAVATGNRMHAKVEGRYVTLFNQNGKISCIDSICHHAGGPLTLGPLQDIEDLGVTVVLCPWHKFMVTIDGGLKAYQAVSFANGKPVNTGWKIGKVVQRPHKVKETDEGMFVVSIGNIPAFS
jgi:nitrite reductase/ring-hydroxylating ferredoxin subunit